MSDLPAHASPALKPTDSPYFPEHPPPSHLRLANSAAASSTSSTPDPASTQARSGMLSHRALLGQALDPTSSQLSDPSEHTIPPPALLSPSFTPPATPGTGTPALERDARSYAVDTSTLPAPRLLPKLPTVTCVVRARIPTTTGVEMFLHLYHNDMDAKEHLAIVFGDRIRSRSLDAPQPGESEMDRMIRGAYVGRLHPGRISSRVDAPNNTTATASPLLRAIQKPGSAVPAKVLGDSALPREGPKAPLVRIHSECYTGETVWSARCDCGEQLDEAARLMSLPSAAESGGVIVYLRQEGRGIGLGEKLKAYNLQDLGNDTVEANLLLRHPADARTYGLATAMLEDLGLGGERGIRLLTNNPDKIRAVEGPNREIVVKERVAMVPLSWSSSGVQGFDSPEVAQYLRTKIEKMGHMLGLSGS